MEILFLVTAVLALAHGNAIQPTSTTDKDIMARITSDPSLRSKLTALTAEYNLKLLEFIGHVEDEMGIVKVDKDALTTTTTTTEAPTTIKVTTTHKASPAARSKVHHPKQKPLRVPEVSEDSSVDDYSSEEYLDEDDEEINRLLQNEEQVKDWKASPAMRRLRNRLLKMTPLERKEWEKKKLQDINNKKADPTANLPEAVKAFFDPKTWENALDPKKSKQTWEKLFPMLTTTAKPEKDGKEKNPKKKENTKVVKEKSIEELSEELDEKIARFFRL